MKQNILEIKNLSVNINDKEIIKGLNLSIKAGEIHAIMGPNGSGKSTLAKVIAGHPLYTITEGSIFLKTQNITYLNPEERAHEGVFLGFQYPVEIPGVNNLDFLRLAYNQKQKINKKETDSGLDIDALKSIANSINQFTSSEKSIILITHYQRLLDYIVPDFVHIMQNGKIIQTGNADLAKKLEKEGYKKLLQANRI